MINDAVHGLNMLCNFRYILKVCLRDVILKIFLICNKRRNEKVFTGSEDGSAEAIADSEQHL